MKAYSQDLRVRILEALESQEDTQAEIAQRFTVSVSFVEKLWQRWRTTGQSGALPHGGGRHRSLAGWEAVMREAIKAEPDKTLAALCERVVQAGGPLVSRKTMCVELQRLQLPRKKSLSTPMSETRRG